jgi:hypothetical protein
MYESNKGANGQTPAFQQQKESISILRTNHTKKLQGFTFTSMDAKRTCMCAVATKIKRKESPHEKGDFITRLDNDRF